MFPESASPVVPVCASPVNPKHAPLEVPAPERCVPEVPAPEHWVPAAPIYKREPPVVPVYTSSVASAITMVIERSFLPVDPVPERLSPSAVPERAPPVAPERTSS